jgi:hypothetical protein
MSSPRALLNAQRHDGEPPGVASRSRHGTGRIGFDANVVDMDACVVHLTRMVTPSAPRRSHCESRRDDVDTDSVDPDVDAAQLMLMLIRCSQQ